jgi:hypothetical protein
MARSKQVVAEPVPANSPEAQHRHFAMSLVGRLILQKRQPMATRFCWSARLA